jgi:2-polyprenyl-6-methoxyphenol hydroxylase-like FAD-dependent oxidoreductase
VRVTGSVPAIEEAGICVLGGSCTGVFAAVRAARLGARVVLVEKQGHFGGVAPIVCTRHGFFDTEFKRPITGGLTKETVDKMRKTGAAEAIENSSSQGHVFRPGPSKRASPSDPRDEPREPGLGCPENPRRKAPAGYRCR